MDGEAVNAIAGFVKKPFEIGGLVARPAEWVLEDPVALVKSGPRAEMLVVHTLGAVRDYLMANKDALDLKTLVVHVQSPRVVQVLGPLDARSRKRECFVEATANDMIGLQISAAGGHVPWLNTFMPLETFLIDLQVRFVEADDRAKLLALLSTVKHESVKTASDNGMTQVVQARVGVVLVADVAVPNPVTLTGFRTFRDVVHPSSLYVLRVQQGRGPLPEVALFEADGGAWKLQAIARVRDWLTEALPKDVAILA